MEPRPTTAFASFINSKREGTPGPAAGAAGALNSPSKQLPVATPVRHAPLPHPQTGRAPPTTALGPRPSSVSVVGAASGGNPFRERPPLCGPSPASSPSALRRAPSSRTAHQPNPEALRETLTVTVAPVPDYRQLAEAASSLAAAAKALAASPKSDSTFAKTYQQLAQAAAELAVHSASQTPAASAAAAVCAAPKQQVAAPPQGQQQQGQHQGQQQQGQGQQGQQQQGQQRPGAQQRAAGLAASSSSPLGGAKLLTPFQQPSGGHTGVPAAAEPAAGSLQQWLQQQLRQRSRPSSSAPPEPPQSSCGARPTTSGGGGYRGVATPRFPGVNPMMSYLRASELGPPPGTPAGASSLRPGAQTRPDVSPSQQRPSTGNPITHTLPDAGAQGLLGPRPGSRATSRGRLQSGSGGGAWGAQRGGREQEEAGSGRLLRSGGGAGDAGQAAQVLVVDHVATGGGGGSAAASEGREPAGERGRQGAGRPEDQAAVDPLLFTMQHPDKVRMAPFPPSTPIRPEDLEEDDLSRRYNAAVAVIREKILSRQPEQVKKSFKMIDYDDSGDISTAEFRSVLKKMDFGVGDVDDKVLDLIAAAMDVDSNGVINFGEFMSAVRFNKIAYRPYNPKFCHKTNGNPDQPLGPTHISVPWGTIRDVDRNTLEHSMQLDGSLDDVRRAFREADADQDGVVDYRQFAKALKSLDEKLDLKFTDEYVLQMWREANKGFAQGVKYEELLGGPGGQATADGHFTTEFLKPKKLRGSQIAPLEWRLSPVQQQAELLASSAATLTRLGTASGGGRGTQRV